MLTLKLPFESLDTVDIIDAALSGSTVDEMKIEQHIKEKYLSLVDLYTLCTRTEAKERPSIEKIIKQLVPMINSGDFTLAVERKPSLVEQLNKYNQAQTNSVKFSDEPNLDAEMEAEINKSKQVVQIRGPQVQQRFSIAHGDRDAIQHGSDIETESSDAEEHVSSGKGHFFKIQRKKSKKGKSKKERKKKVVATQAEVTGTPDPGIVTLKVPKRNTISKSIVESQPQRS